MSTNYSISRPETNFLKYAIRGNALFSATSGLALTFLAGGVSDLTSIQPPLAITITGLILIGYAVWLWRLTTQDVIPSGLAWFVIALDAAWVIGSVLAILASWSPLTQTGKWLVAILADVVGLFAVLQFIGLRRTESEA
jgi:hypothetical protein